MFARSAVPTGMRKSVCVGANVTESIEFHTFHSLDESHKNVGQLELRYHTADAAAAAALCVMFTLAPILFASNFGDDTTQRYSDVTVWHSRVTVATTFLDGMCV